MDYVKYKSEILQQLNDQDCYLKLNIDPTFTYENKTNATLIRKRQNFQGIFKMTCLDPFELSMVESTRINSSMPTI